jgi:hypothetical protein
MSSGFFSFLNENKVELESIGVWVFFGFYI